MRGDFWLIHFVDFLLDGATRRQTRMRVGPSTETEAPGEIEAESSDAIAELKMRFRDKISTPPAEKFLVLDAQQLDRENSEFWRCFELVLSELVIISVPRDHDSSILRVCGHSF